MPFSAQPESLFLLGVMGVALALAGFAAQRARRFVRWMLPPCVAVAAGWGCAEWAGVPADFLALALVVVLGWVAVVSLRSPLVVKSLRAGATVCHRPAAGWCVLFLGAATLTVAAALASGYDDKPISDETWALDTFRVDLDRDQVLKAHTDRGRAVSVAVPYEVDLELLKAKGERFVERSGLLRRAIALAEPNPNSNCHGWVFAAGRFWVAAKAIDTILEDNGYKQVPAPAADDVAIYRDARGLVTHTGLVRGLTSDGRVLVESKWTGFGRFMHVAEDQPYAGKPAYYRSPRTGHTLRGVDDLSATVRRFES